MSKRTAKVVDGTKDKYQVTETVLITKTYTLDEVNSHLRKYETQIVNCKNKVVELNKEKDKMVGLKKEMEKAGVIDD